MNFPAKIGVIKFGYGVEVALADPNEALQLMALLGKATCVVEDGYTHREKSGKKFFLAQDPTTPELRFVPMAQFDTQHTSAEAEEVWKREQEDREDLSGGVREVPTVYAIPAPTTEGLSPDHEAQL